MTIRFLALETQRMLRRWERQPTMAAIFLLLVGLITLGGPGACLLHCVLDHRAQQASALHAGHNPDGMHTPAGAQVPCPCEAGAPSAPQPAHQEPSPLTIAVLLPGVILLLLATSRDTSAAREATIRSLALPPPLQPPRRFITVPV